MHAVTTAMLVLMIVHDSPTPTAEDAPAAAFDELISPELALVDPDLARRARAWLASTEAPPSPVPPIRRAAESAPARAATSTAPPVPAATPTTPPAPTRRAVAEPPRATVAPRPARARRFRPRTAVRTALLLLVGGLAAAALAGTWDATERPYLVPAVDEQPAERTQSPATDGARAAVPAAGNTDGGTAGRAPAPAPTESADDSVKPTTPSREAAPARQTARPRPPVASRIFVWAPVAEATHYRVEFYRDGRRVLLVFPTRPRITLPRQWEYLGRTIRLQPGTYRWIVSPGFGPRTSARYGQRAVASTWQPDR